MRLNESRYVIDFAVDRDPAVLGRMVLRHLSEGELWPQHTDWFEQATGGGRSADCQLGQINAYLSIAMELYSAMCNPY